MAEDADKGGEKTFTQADVDRVVRERLAREREKYADYDDLKAKAGEADKSKSAMDKLLEKVSGLEQRAEKAELAALRAEVAEAKGLTAKQARRLQGKTREELLTDADDLLADWKPADSGGDGDGQGDSGGTDGADSKSADTQQSNSSTSRGRPREALRSGAPVPEQKPDETDPMKLAALVPRQ